MNTNARKALLIFGLTITILPGCKKKYCWKCTIESGRQLGGIKSSNTTTEDVCDKTKKEIRDYEDDNSSTETGTGGVAGLIETKTTRCEKQ